MAKQELYVATRSKSRLDGIAQGRVIERFISNGKFAGSSHSVVMLANLCLERGWRFSLEVLDLAYEIKRL